MSRNALALHHSRAVSGNFTLTAYDLNTGTIKWQIPDGGVTALAEQGHGGTGALAPRGGIVATASGRLFVATVYEIDGREYIALCAASETNLPVRIGSGKPAIPARGAYLVFALARK